MKVRLWLGVLFFFVAFQTKGQGQWSFDTLSYQQATSDEMLRAQETNPVLFLRLTNNAAVSQLSNKQVLGRGWLAMTRNDFISQQVAERFRPEFVGLLKAESKLSEDFLRSPEFADSYRGNQPVTTAVFFFGVRPEEVRDKLLSLGIREVSLLPGTSAVQVTANAAALKRLAEWSFVLHIAPLSEARTPLANLAITMNRVNLVHQATPEGFGLKGEGVSIGVWDFGAPGNHFDLEFSIVNAENDFFNNTGSQHTSFVTGAIAGKGVIREDILGMAPEATVYAYNFFGNVFNEMESAFQQYNIAAANHSYNVGSAFNCDSVYSYDAASALMDAYALDRREVLQVFAAGNSAAGCPFDYVNIVPGYQYGKNHITVGNLQNNETLYPGSAKGPTSDGRLKPEICAKGASTFTPSATGIILPSFNQNYATGFGTSFAAPQIAAIGGLLQQAADQLANPRPSAPLQKAILCNTAKDLGNPGPDYEYGFGRVDAYKAIKAYNAGWYLEDSVAHGQTKNFSINVPANTAALKVLLTWFEPATALPVSRVLVQDLDLSVAQGVNTYQPFVLNPDSPSAVAVSGRDSLNTVEQVVVVNPSAGLHTISVEGFDLPAGVQRFSLTWYFDSIAAQITFPAPGEVVVANANTYIRWDANGISGNLAVEYSLNGGVSWTFIDSVAAQQGGILWAVPNTFSDSALVRLKSGATVYAQIAGFFNIIARPATSAITICDNGVRFSWNAINGADSYAVSIFENGIWRDLDTVKTTIFYFRKALNGFNYTLAVRPLFKNKSGPRSIALIRTPRSGFVCSYPDNDLGIVALRPFSGRLNTSTALGSSVPIRARLQNYRNALANYNVTLRWQVNGGAVYDSTFNVNIAGNSSVWFTTANTFNFSSEGSYEIKVWLSSASDLFPENDTLIRSIRQLPNPIIELPYSQDFEVDVFTAVDSIIGLPALDAFDFMPVANGRATNVGSQVLALSGRRAVTLDNFGDNNVNAGANLLLTLDLSTYADSLVYFDFDYRSRGEAAGNDSVYIRGADTDVWLPVFDLFSSALSNAATRKVRRINLSKILDAGGQSFGSSAQIRVGVNSGRAATWLNTNGGYTFDDFFLFSPGKDVELLSVNFVSSKCVQSIPGTDLLTFEVRLRNNYPAAVSNVDLFFSDGDTTIKLASVNVTAFDTLVATYTVPVKFDSTGIAFFDVWLEAAEDRLKDNDSVTGLYLIGLASLTLPYLNTFETDTLPMFSVSGQNSSWEMGSPTKTLMYAAASGENAWATRLQGFYNTNELSYLYLGCLDPTALDTGMLAFHHLFQLESGFDKVTLEFAQQDDIWQPLGRKDNGFNWFNQSGSYPGWEGERSVWQSASYPIAADTFGGSNPVRLRFSLFSDQIITFEGFALDDVYLIANANAITKKDSLVYTESSSGAGMVQFRDGNNAVVARLDDKGQSLGAVSLAVRSRPCVPYLNNRLLWPRVYALQAQNQPANPIDLALYVTNEEYLRLVAANPDLRSMRELGVWLYNGSNIDTLGTNNQLGAYTFIPRDSLRFLPYGSGYELTFQLPFAPAEIYFGTSEAQEVWLRQPADASACRKSFKAVSNLPAPSYRWQLLNAGVWQDISLSNTDFAGANTDSLTLIANFGAYDSTVFRLRAADTLVCSIFSDSVRWFATAKIILPDTGTYVLTGACDDGEWTYYSSADQPGGFMLAINWAPDLSLSANNAVAKANALPVLRTDPSFYTVSDLSGPDPLATFSMRRYWNVDLNGNDIDEPVTLRFYYDSTEASAIVQAAQNFATTNGGMYEGFEWFKTASAAFVPATNVQPANVLEALKLTNSNATSERQSGVLFADFENIPGFSGGTAATGVGPNSDPLPVIWLYFRANCTPEGRLLEWATASEFNADYFEVQLSLNGIDFLPLARVPAAGTSSVPLFYNWLDTASNGQTRYYRIRQLDFNGDFTLSSVIESSCALSSDSYFAFYRNGTGEIILDVLSARDKQVSVELLDVSGRLIFARVETLGAGNNRFAYPTEQLPKGMYLLNVSDASFKGAFKLMVY